jgi:ribose transport system ATP-binding protein
MSDDDRATAATRDPVAAVAATGVSKRFAGVLALDAVSLALRPGEVHGLVGENGAGKSTLIKIFTGVHQPDAGEVLVRGVPAVLRSPADARRLGIASIYQEIGLVPLLSVARNVMLGREPRTRLGLVDGRCLEADARGTLARFGLDVDVRRPLRDLGIGTQQMVAIARAIGPGGAHVVVMDEPTSALEPREVDTLLGVVERLRADGVAVLYVSHRLDELYRVCEHLTVLRDGRVVASVPTAELPRLELVAAMLGRELAAARARGRPAGDAASPEPRSPVVPGADGGGPAPVAPAAGDDPAPSPARAALHAADLHRPPRLRGVSVTARHGEVVGLAGLLGAGRTETLRAIMGADPVDGGVVTVAGRRLRRGSVPAAVAAGLAFLPEDRGADGILPELSVRDNIALAALPRLSRAGVVSERRIDELVEVFVRRLRIKTASVHQKAGELSGGNQQKVLLARWLCTEPMVLLLDEPTRGIDVGAKAEVQTLVYELAERGLAIVLVSSDLDEVVDMADRLVVLRDGAVAGTLRGPEVRAERVLDLIAADAGPPAPDAGRGAS